MFTITTATLEIVLFGYLYAVADIKVTASPESVEGIEIVGYNLYDAEGTPVEVAANEWEGVTHAGVMEALILPVGGYVESRTDYYIQRAKGL